MAILKVARMGHPVLRQKAREVSAEEIRSDGMKALIADMKETMAEYRGIGLAAPQVHVPLRVAIVGYTKESERYPDQGEQELGVYFNPKVKVTDKAVQGYWEGCLSVPGLRGYVERPSGISVRYLDENAEERTLEAEGFLATVFQHEFDHLDGVLYPDRIKDKEKFSFDLEYERFHLPEA